MRKFPLTSAFIKIIEDTAEHNKAKKVNKIFLTVGKGVFFKSGTSTYMENILKGTAARDAEIFIRCGHTAGKCRCCGLVFSNERNLFCPECGGAGDNISLEKRFIIDMIEIESGTFS